MSKNKSKSIDYLVLAEPEKGAGHIARFVTLFHETKLKYRLNNLFFIGDEKFLINWLDYFKLTNLKIYKLSKALNEEYCFENVISDCLCYDKYLKGVSIKNLIAFEDFCSSNPYEWIRINSFAGDLSSNSMTLSGVEYELLRPDVDRIRKKIKKFNIELKKNSTENLKLGYVFGGSDPMNFSNYFLTPGNLNFDNLKNETNFIECLSGYDIIFSSAGRMVLECLALGVIPVVLFQNKREANNHQELQKFLPEIFPHREMFTKDNSLNTDRIEEQIYFINGIIDSNKNNFIRRLNVYRELLGSKTTLKILDKLFNYWD